MEGFGGARGRFCIERETMPVACCAIGGLTRVMGAGGAPSGRAKGRWGHRRLRVRLQTDQATARHGFLGGASCRNRCALSAKSPIAGKYSQHSTACEGPPSQGATATCGCGGLPAQRTLPCRKQSLNVSVLCHHQSPWPTLRARGFCKGFAHTVLPGVSWQ